MLGWIDLSRSDPSSPELSGDLEPRPESSTEQSASGGFAFNALLTGLAQSAVAIAAGINAALLGSRYPASVETDGLFTAFAVYGMVVIISASSRTALVPHLLDEQRSFRQFNEMLVAILWAIPIIGLLFAFALPPAITATTGDASSEIVRATLLILWPAAVGQFIAALGAAMLGVLDDFHSAAFGYTGGGVTSVAAFLVLEPAIGLKALPVAVLAGTFVMVAFVLGALLKRGWRFGRISLSPTISWRWNKTLLMGSAYFIFGQSLYLVSVAVAAQTVGEGSATLYAYGYFAIGLVISFASVGTALVLAAPVASDWDDDPATLEPIENDAVRATMLLLAGFVPAVALLGDDIAGAVLVSFSDADVRQIIDVLIALTPMAMAVQIGIVPLLAIFARKQLGTAALVGLATLTVQIPVTLALGTLGDLTSIAIAASIAQLLQAVLLLSLIHESEAARRIGSSVRDAALIAVPAAIAFVAARALADAAGLDEMARDAVAYLAGSALLLAVIWLAIPIYRNFIRGVSGSLLTDARQLGA